MRVTFRYLSANPGMEQCWQKKLTDLWSGPPGYFCQPGVCSFENSIEFVRCRFLTARSGQWQHQALAFFDAKGMSRPHEVDAFGLKPVFAGWHYYGDDAV